MSKHLLFFLVFFAFSCDTDSSNDIKALYFLGSWEIKEVNFKVDGKLYAASTAKLYQANISQLVWDFKSEFILEERQNVKTFSHNYDFSDKQGSIIISGNKLFTELFYLNLSNENLEARSKELTDLSFDYSHNSEEGNLIQDAVFMLEGQLPESEIRNAASLQKIYVFSKIEK
ncbi:hypothetical protein [Arcticibacterium luteifluviistationis]|uniref:Lipocalin-like domain-containing protein n=1 Tax=Arcticibacterium luteifluviistationis TaxID=1784714 RepID=A0A2Z4GAQ9_9BACT|nr:hypothetical protein [Arcticibacterium luteifluviistationis]AWV98165.1 hypothetical protein DJ013_08255 [Arcticibacterium luteifluviistationis]